jgi:methyl-accepting chemotaxis protein
MEMKQAMMEELPQILDRIEDTARKVYNPHDIWLESMQFADYVSQLSKHLNDDHGFECVQEIATQLQNMSNSFKQMGEGALQVLDEIEKDSDGTR